MSAPVQPQLTDEGRMAIRLKAKEALARLSRRPATDALTIRDLEDVMRMAMAYSMDSCLLLVARERERLARTLEASWADVRAHVARIAREGITKTVYVKGDAPPHDEALTRALLGAWQGPWEEGVTYREHDLTTHGGGLWLAMQRPTGRPGDAGRGWRLIVKGGRTRREPQDIRSSHSSGSTS
jgi:hypothetical protein